MPFNNLCEFINKPASLTSHDSVINKQVAVKFQISAARLFRICGQKRRMIHGKTEEFISAKS